MNEPEFLNTDVDGIFYDAETDGIRMTAIFTVQSPFRFFKSGDFSTLDFMIFNVRTLKVVIEESQGYLTQLGTVFRLLDHDEFE